MIFVSNVRTVTERLNSALIICTVNTLEVVAYGNTLTHADSISIQFFFSLLVMVNSMRKVGDDDALKLARYSVFVPGRCCVTLVDEKVVCGLTDGPALDFQERWFLSLLYPLCV